MRSIHDNRPTDVLNMYAICIYVSAYKYIRGIGNQRLSLWQKNWRLETNDAGIDHSEKKIGVKTIHQPRKLDAVQTRKCEYWYKHTVDFFWLLEIGILESENSYIHVYNSGHIAIIIG